MLSYAATAIIGICFACYIIAMLPFLADQLIGATSDELSAVVHWYYWTETIGFVFSNIIADLCLYDNPYYIYVTLIFAVPLAVIIISDFLCQQWLDKTHKVTNPIKLIIQVLNYTRKHSYPERRSAFTYIDEEQPTRMDYGKEKFGGPFTEEEVEDVKTVLRLLPLVICLSLSVGALSYVPHNIFRNNDFIFDFLNGGLKGSLFPLLMVPIYQLIVRPCTCRCSTSMLQCICISLLLYTMGSILLLALEVLGVIRSHQVARYLSCTANVTHPASYMEWYWKLGPSVMHGTGKAMAYILLLEFTIAQSPDKMKGLAIGIMVACQGFLFMIHVNVMQFSFTLCSDLAALIAFVVLVAIFLVLSKSYTLRERNRVINIQAIVEEHYERYMDQEEEYMRQQHF